MGQITVVDGLEMFCIPHSKGVRCDKCDFGMSSSEIWKAVLSKGEVVSGTREQLAALGWTYRGGNVDWCPKCSTTDP